MNTSRKIGSGSAPQGNRPPTPFDGQAHCLLDLMGEKVLVTGYLESGILVRIDLKTYHGPRNIHQTNCPLLCKRLAGLIHGKRTSLGLPFDLRGTKFQREVWRITTAIPFGQTRSYGQVARQMECNSPRAVGQALKANPLPIVVPCHRVIGRDGSLTGFSKGLAIKGLLLNVERHGAKTTSLRRNRHEDRGNE